MPPIQLYYWPRVICSTLTVSSRRIFCEFRYTRFNNGRITRPLRYQNVPYADTSTKEAEWVKIQRAESIASFLEGIKYAGMVDGKIKMRRAHTNFIRHGRSVGIVEHHTPLYPRRGERGYLIWVRPTRTGPQLYFVRI